MVRSRWIKSHDRVKQCASAWTNFAVANKLYVRSLWFFFRLTVEPPRNSRFVGVECGRIRIRGAPLFVQVRGLVHLLFPWFYIHPCRYQQDGFIIYGKLHVIHCCWASEILAVRKISGFESIRSNISYSYLAFSTFFLLYCENILFRCSAVKKAAIICIERLVYKQLRLLQFTFDSFILFHALLRVIFDFVLGRRPSIVLRSNRWHSCLNPMGKQFDNSIMFYGFFSCLVLNFNGSINLRKQIDLKFRCHAIFCYCCLAGLF